MHHATTPLTNTNYPQTYPFIVVLFKVHIVRRVDVPIDALLITRYAALERDPAGGRAQDEGLQIFDDLR